MTARDYVVGLPVVVTVEDDGTVRYTVDTSEAASEIREAISSSAWMDLTPSEEQVEADAARVESDPRRWVQA